MPTWLSWEFYDNLTSQVITIVISSNWMLKDNVLSLSTLPLQGNTIIQCLCKGCKSEV